MYYVTLARTQTQTQPRSRPRQIFCHLVLSSIVVFSVIVVILAAPRIVTRLNVVFNHLKYRPPQIPIVAPPPNSAPFSNPTASASHKPVQTQTAADAMAKYTQPPQPPPLFTGTKESIVQDVKALCDDARAQLDKLVADVPADTSEPTSAGKKATFDTVMRPQIAQENQISLQAHILVFYRQVSADEALRDASTEAAKMLEEFSIERGMREDVFRLVDAAYVNSGLKSSRDANKDRLIDGDLARQCGLEDVESARLLERERLGYIRNGLGLPAGPKRDRFKEIRNRLSQIQIAFQQNLNDENNGIWFTAEELEGVPSDVVDNLEKGSGDNDGKFKLTFKYPDLFPALKFAKNADIRKQIFIQSENKVCSCPAPNGFSSGVAYSH